MYRYRSDFRPPPRRNKGVISRSSQAERKNQFRRKSKNETNSSFHEIHMHINYLLRNVVENNSEEIILDDCENVGDEVDSLSAVATMADKLAPLLASRFKYRSEIPKNQNVTASETTALVEDGVGPKNPQYDEKDLYVSKLSLSSVQQHQSAESTEEKCDMTITDSREEESKECNVSHGRRQDISSDLESSDTESCYSSSSFISEES